MIRPQLSLDINDELIVDNFAGGGGASTGIELALGRPVDLAWNHCRDAVAMHQANHPTTVHYCESVWDAKPAEATAGRPVGLAWFSPDCKHFSKAKGGKPREKKIRGLAWVILNWVREAPPRVIMLENVEEFKTWCPLITPKAARRMGNPKLAGHPNPWRKGWFFQCFIGALRRRGYHVETNMLRGMCYGAATRRRRLFLIARNDGRPVVWPDASHTRKAERAPRTDRWKIAADHLDFSLPCPSIFLTPAEAKHQKCKRPLVRSTLSRLAKGVDRCVLKAEKPFIVSLTHHGGDRIEDIGEPIKTITGANRGEKALVVPILSYAQHGGRTLPANGPCHTIAASTKDQNQLISLYLAQHNGGFNDTPGHPVTQPSSTISSRGSQQQLVGVTMIPYYGNERDTASATEPARTITTRARFGLAEVFGTVTLTPEQEAGARRVAAFLREYGVEFEGEFVTVNGHVVVDIGMRMLTPRELYLLQGFPADYVIEWGYYADEATGRLVRRALTKTKQIRMVGNSVCPPVAAAIVRANVPELAAWTTQERQCRRPAASRERILAHA